MKCEEVRDEMIAYLKGELDEERKNEIDEHLARCEGCRRELEVSRRVLFQTQAANEASIVKMVDGLIEEAVYASASDIHVDPTREGADVRLRIDGVLHPVKQLSAQERDAVVARIKIMAGASISENRLPQDGRVPFKVGDREYDLRLSTMPFLLGEKVVMRILDRGTPMLGLEKLGFLPEHLEAARALLHLPCGVVISTGPTGSGKTTLLYSMILELIKPEINIMTIEDPIEYEINGIEQAQVNARIGLTTATALRTFMRQDPDVIGIGEMHDLETMEVAAHAAMTGHLILSQMLPPDAASVPQRLVSCGVEPWIVGSTLAGVIACRLVRRICPDCREEYTPAKEALDYLGLQNQVGKVKFYHGKGCEKCNGTGHRNRAQLHEVLTIDRGLSSMISSGQADADAVFKYAVSKGFITMAEDARRKVLDSITTAEEAYRVLA